MTPEPPTPIEAAERGTDYISGLDPDSYEHTVAMHMLEQLAVRGDSMSMISLVQAGMDRAGLGLGKTKEVFNGLVDGGYIARPKPEGGMHVNAFELTEKGEDFFTAPR